MQNAIAVRGTPVPNLPKERVPSEADWPSGWVGDSSNANHMALVAKLAKDKDPITHRRAPR